MKIKTTCAALLVAACAFSTPAMAQNISGVSGAKITDGQTDGEFRLGFEPREDGDDDAIAGRFHVQHGISDRLRVRGVLFARDRGDGLETNAAAVELHYQFTEDKDATQFGARMGLRRGWNGTSDRLQLNMIGEHKIDADWSVRGNLLVDRRLDDGDKTPTFGARGRIKRGLGDVDVSLEAFAGAGRLTRRDDESLQLGPMVEFDLGRFGVSAGYLAGVHDAPAHNFRLFIGTKFN